jgi:tellurite resistance protein TehA-like permease
MTFFQLLKKEIAGLLPASFALVMATGILSIASFLFNLHAFSDILFWLNNVQYAVLITFLLLRIIFYFRSFLDDLFSHLKGPGFFTLPAATCILGLQYVILKQNFQTANVLWYFAIAIWFLLLYSFLFVVIVKPAKPAVEKGFGGIWLLLVVATQSVSILGSTLSEHLALSKETVVFFTAAVFLCGSLLYIILITIDFYRLCFFPINAKDFTPPYWINMGAAAISALAAVTVAQKMNGVTNLQPIVPFVKGLAFFSWAAATWWIPIIIMVEAWRHGYKRVPVSYDASYWSVVFCLGMYTVCSLRLGESFETPHLQFIPETFIYFTHIAWILVFFGMCMKFIKGLRAGYFG